MAQGEPSRITVAPAAPPGLALGPQGLIRRILGDYLVRTTSVERERLGVGWGSHNFLLHAD